MLEKVHGGCVVVIWLCGKRVGLGFGVCASREIYTLLMGSCCGCFAKWVLERDALSCRDDTNESVTLL
jgi:hypothetical protein